MEDKEILFIVIMGLCIVCIVLFNLYSDEKYRKQYKPSCKCKNCKHFYKCTSSVGMVNYTFKGGKYRDNPYMLGEILKQNSPNNDTNTQKVEDKSR